MSNNFIEEYRATIVSQFHYSDCDVNKKAYRIQFLDLSGQEEYILVAKLFCEDSDGYIIVTDGTKPKSLKE